LEISTGGGSDSHDGRNPIIAAKKDSRAIFFLNIFKL
jgi:hypothetical protein